MPARTRLAARLQVAFVAAFRVANGVYDLGGKVYPGSIRDQVIRARLFTDHLRNLDLNGSGKTVCIIGAGPAGVTVAMQLGRLPNVTVYLVDKNPRPLSVLGGITHRLISPTLYDWPAAHSSYIKYGARPRYEEGRRPYEIRNAWLGDFEEVRQLGQIVWVGETAASPMLDGSGPPWKVELSGSPGGVPASFDIVLLCRGLAKERGLPNVQGRSRGTLEPIPFWKNDPYPVAGQRSLPQWSATGQSYDCAVAILGGGDGAIQDMLRFITNGRDGRDILNEITGSLESRSTMLSELLGHVENLARLEAIGTDAAGLRSDLISKMENDVRHLMGDEGLTETLSRMIECASLRIYFRDSELGPCYPLNRFLALLFRECIRKRHGVDIFFPNREAELVECQHDSESHFDEDHLVRFKGGSEKVRCRVVVLRLGVDWTKVPSDRPDQSQLTHALPYWLAEWKPVR